MLNLGTSELLVIAVVALVVLGPDRLPEAARHAGTAMAELRRVTSGFQHELHQAANGHVHPMELQTPREAPIDERGALGPSADARRARRPRPLTPADGASEGSPRLEAVARVGRAQLPPEMRQTRSQT